MGLGDYLSLIRPKQYYKNLLVFLAPFFGGVILNAEYWVPLIIAFISLCLASSASYIINDVVDAPFDRKNPEKKNRPIASGSIKPFSALLLALFLIAASLALAISVNSLFAVCVGLLFILSQAYTFYFKNIAFADVNLIAVNFLLRAISGSYVVGVITSPWLIMIVYFFALYLALSKRYGEKIMVKGDGHRKSLSRYSLETLKGMLTASLAVLLVLVVFYLFQKHSIVHFAAMPFIVYVLFKLYDPSLDGGKVQRDFGSVFRHLDIVFAGAIVLLIMTASIYLGI